MKIQRLFSILLFCLMLGSGSLMAQSMSDSQVLEYVKDGIRQGKEQKQLASELARKGVTKEQAMRVKQLYEQQNNVNTSKSTGTDINESRLREETKKNTSDMLEDHPTTQDLARGDQVFGRNIFNTRNLTFEPSVNLATPANYRLGPGDEVIIDIWGASQNTIRQQISPEGTINIQKIGPVNLSGMTVSAANDYLKNALNKIYNGLNNTTDPTSDIRLTLGNIRTIQINVMGYSTCDVVSLHIPATAETKNSINYALVNKMPKGGLLVNTARKEVINEAELIQLMEERPDLKYMTDIMPAANETFAAKFAGRYFSTPKKMGAQTAEANINAGIAAAKQIVGFLKDGCEKFRVNK